MSDRPELPPVVYVPCVDRVDDPAAARVEMRRTRDGRTALLVYSALDRMHRCCGVAQPWVLLRTTALADGVLDAIAGMLRTAADGLEGLVGALPAPPDAGDATALVTELLAELVRRAGEVATGSGAAAELVVQCSSAYFGNEGAIAADMDCALPAAES